MPTLKDPTMINNLSIYLPLPKEKKDDKLKREKRFKEDFTEIWNNLEDEREPSPFPPSSWEESLSSEHSKKNLTPLFNMIMILSPALSNQEDIIKLLNMTGNTFIATIASGHKNKALLIHSLEQVGTKLAAIQGLDNSAPVAEIEPARFLDMKFSTLPTSETIANLAAQERSTYKTNENKTTPISNAIFLPNEFTQHLTDYPGEILTENLLTHFLAWCTDEDEEMGIDSYIDSTTEIENEDEDEEDNENNLSQNNSNTRMKVNKDSYLNKFEHTIQTLFKWQTQTRSIKTCVSQSIDEALSIWKTTKLNSLATKPEATTFDPNAQNTIANSVSFDKEDTPTKRPLLESPTKKNPHINLTGRTSKSNEPHSLPKANLTTRFDENKDSTNNTKKCMTEITQHNVDNEFLTIGEAKIPLSDIMKCLEKTSRNPPSIANPFSNNTTTQPQQSHPNTTPAQNKQNQNPATNTNNNLRPQQSQPQTTPTQNPIQTPNNQTTQTQQNQTQPTSSQQQAQNNTATLQNQSSLLQQTLISLLNSNIKAEETQERLVNSHEAMVKLKEENKKNKISTPTANFIKNIFTEDGLTPQNEVPSGIKELMTSTADTTAANIDLILNKEKTPAKPTINFIKALQKGQYHYETGQPGNLSPMGIPNMLHGQNQENINIGQLLTAEANKDDLSPQEKKLLTATTIFPPRTINYAIKEVTAFTSVIKQGGDNTLIYHALAEFSEWMIENEQILSENTAAIDKHLPAKITYALGEAVNNFFKTGRYCVPSLTWLDFNDLKTKSLLNQLSIILPPSITKILEPKRKRDEPNSGGRGGGDTDDPDKRRRFQVEKHDNQPPQLKCSREMYKAVINKCLKADIKAPQNDGEDECLRWCFLGACTSTCKRQGNHKPVKTGTPRCNDLLNFRKKALKDYNETKSEDDQNFS